MPIEQVGRLLRRWQETGGVLSRGRVIADGMRLLSSLTPDERRILARALAEEGAPDLAGRLAPTSGGRIDAGELHRAAEGLLALDRDQIDHLARTLGDRDERLRLAHEAATFGADQLAQAAGPGAELDPPDPVGPTGPAQAAAAPGTGDVPGPPPAPGTRLPPPPGAPDPATSPSYATDSLHALANGQVAPDDIELGDQMLDHPGLSDIRLGEADIQEVGIGEVALHEVSLAANEVVTAQADDSGPVTDAAGTTGAVVVETHRSAPPAPAEQPAEPATADETPLVHLDRLGSVGPDPTTTADAPDRDHLVEQLRHASSAHDRFLAVSRDRVSGMDPATALRALDAVPEGWQRRRVARRLGAAGAFRDVQPRELFARFPRSSDAAFVAGAALDDGSYTLEALEDVLPARLARRLTIRAGA